LGLSVEFSERVELPEPDDPAGRLYAGMLVREEREDADAIGPPKTYKACVRIEKGFYRKTIPLLRELAYEQNLFGKLIYL